MIHCIDAGGDLNERDEKGCTALIAGQQSPIRPIP